MYGPDSCLQRCRALNKLPGNFLVSMLLTEGRDYLLGPRRLKPAQAAPPGGDLLVPAGPAQLSPGWDVWVSSSVAFGLKPRKARRQHRREEIALASACPRGLSPRLPGKARARGDTGTGGLAVWPPGAWQGRWARGPPGASAAQSPAHE